MLRADIEAARAAWIEAAEKDPVQKEEREQSEFLLFLNKAGETFDFHGFRHSYVSALVNGGASVKVAQELARHSTPTLTIGRYAHTRLYDLAGALDSLPNIQSVEKTTEPKWQLATGTDGPIELTTKSAQRQAQRA